MNLLLIGCNFRSAGIGLRERLAGDAAKLYDELLARFGGEAVALSTCNRWELYLCNAGAGADAITEFLTDRHGLKAAEAKAALYRRRDGDAVRHLFRVAASLDSLVVGEAQIAGQVKRAYEAAQASAAAGPLLHALFRHARRTAKRVRRETGIGQGHVSVSTLAVDYLRQVFSHFGDKTVLVIGAGKMGRLTLDHVRRLGVRRVRVANRSPEKAREVAGWCGGEAVPWERLDAVLSEADIVLSTTGAPEPVMTAERFAAVLARRAAGPMVIIDIAVPRDFDPAIHDGDRVCLFNIDDLERIRERTLAQRSRHIGPAEAIAEQEALGFTADWARRRHGPVIARLTADLEAKRQAVLQQLLSKLNGRLTDADKKAVEGAFRLLQNQFLHGPISALGEASRDGRGSTLLEALRQLFRINE